jgi:hypothetical protein
MEFGWVPAVPFYLASQLGKALLWLPEQWLQKMSPQTQLWGAFPHLLYGNCRLSKQFNTTSVQSLNPNKP